NDMQEMRIMMPTPEKLLTPGVIVLLSLMVAGFLGLSLAPDAVLGTLALNPQGVLHGRIWQLVTYPFVNGTCGLLCNGLIVLFIGSSVEREWRTKSFISLWLIVSIVCGILWVLLTMLTGRPALGMGAGACGYGLIATMGLLFRGRRFLMILATLEAQHIAIGLIVLGVILSLPQPLTLVWVAGALVAYLYVKARWSLRDRPAVRTGPRRSGAGGQFVDID
ncbi:MAG: rhomboid family intramembrane serine protease, partial [Planctomycetes bacterium]|nr:rhomboid family intramembrane serine protease [Planctomycetota bacterium]